MSTIESQFPPFIPFTVRSRQYSAIDPKTTLKDSVSGKTVLLAGASQGIGRATAVAFARAGAQAVYLTARSKTALSETQALVRMANPQTQCVYRLCDVTDGEQVRVAVDDCVAQFGAIDVAVCNAGYLDKWAKIGESDPASWWYTWEVNLKGTYHVVRYTIPHLIESAREHASRGATGGHLILLSSIGAQLLTDGASDYQTSKHAINRLCEFINHDHGAEGVKCFAIHPGGVATKLAKKMPEFVHATLGDEPELPAGFIVWLCSGQADWARGRYLSAQWDVDEIVAMKDQILAADLYVNCLRTKA